MANPVVGDLQTIVVTYTNRSNVAVNPSYIKVKYKTPVTQVVSEIDWPPTSGTVRNVSVGHFEFDITYAEAGTYWVRVESDLGIIEGYVTVVASRVI